jgi:hypothetical protein
MIREQAMADLSLVTHHDLARHSICAFFINAWFS